MSYQSPEYRLALMASRLKHVIRSANLKDDEFITLRVSITNKEGVLLKGGKLSELDEIPNDKAVI